MKYTVAVGEHAVQVDVQGDAILVDGARIRARLTSVPRTPLRQLALNGRARTLAMLPADEGWLVQWAGEVWSVSVVDERTQQLRELTGQSRRGAGGGVIKAPMPGLVLRLEVEPGMRIEQGAGVVVLEAMKMENEITSPTAGIVKAVRVAAGQAVEKGVVLVEIGDEA